MYCLQENVIFVYVISLFAKDLILGTLLTWNPLEHSMSVSAENSLPSCFLNGCTTGLPPVTITNLLIFFSFIFICWRLITLQYCSGFLPYINMNQPWIYMCSPSRSLLPPPSPSHPSGPAQDRCMRQALRAGALGRPNLLIFKGKDNPGGMFITLPVLMVSLSFKIYG